MPKSQCVLNFVNHEVPTDFAIIQPFNVFPQQAFTIELWIKTMDGSKNPNSTSLSYAVEDEANEVTLFGVNSLFFYLQNKRKNSKVKFKDGQWHHCAVTWESSTGAIQIYKDGQSAFSTTVDRGLSIRPSGSLVLGQDQDSYGGGFSIKDAFQGQLAEVRIWDSVRTPEEIEKTIKQRCTGEEPGLVGYWPLDEGYGNIINDKTSNANQGKIYGAAWETTDTLPLAPLPKKQTSVTNRGKLSIGTGLEDYSRWKSMFQNYQRDKNEKPFRRGRIWS